MDRIKEMVSRASNKSWSYLRYLSDGVDNKPRKTTEQEQSTVAWQCNKARTSLENALKENLNETHEKLYNAVNNYFHIIDKCYKDSITTEKNLGQFMKDGDTLIMTLVETTQNATTSKSQYEQRSHRNQGRQQGIVIREPSSEYQAEIVQARLELSTAKKSFLEEFNELNTLLKNDQHAREKAIKVVNARDMDESTFKAALNGT